jgi:thiamine phosphate synthase YjbQ (UPF0047 family)
VRAHTDYLWFETRSRRDLVNVTERVADVVEASGVAEGFCPTGEDNADAHLKRTVVHHQVVLPSRPGSSTWVRGSGVLCGVRRQTPQARGGEGPRGTAP